MITTTIPGFDTFLTKLPGGLGRPQQHIFVAGGLVSSLVPSCLALASPTIFYVANIRSVRSPCLDPERQ